MSQENVELVRRTIDSLNKGEIDRVMDEVGDDFEADWSNSIGPLNGIYRGRQEMLKAWRFFLDAWDELISGFSHIQSLWCPGGETTFDGTAPP